MGGNVNRGDGKNGNGNVVLEWERVGMGMIRWEWEGNENKKVIPAHLYTKVADDDDVCSAVYCSVRLFGGWYDRQRSVSARL